MVSLTATLLVQWGPLTLEPETIGRILFALWIVAFGSCVGSFLNVVIYRLPAGMHVVYPGSRCPRCGHAIRWYDNVPVLSWLWLRARCRDCQAPIAARYPSVEALVAGLFLLLFLVEGNSGGANLPSTWWRRMQSGVSWQVLGIMAYHLAMLCTLVCTCLIRFDGHRVPGRLIGFALVVGLAAAAFWPEMHPVPLHVRIRGPGWLLGPIEGMVGGLIGFLVGLLNERSVSHLSRRLRVRHGTLPEMWTIGVFLGWQAALVVGLITWSAGATLWQLRGQFPRSRWLPRAALALSASLIYIVVWKLVSDHVPILGGRWP